MKQKPSPANQPAGTFPGEPYRPKGVPPGAVWRDAPQSKSSTLKQTETPKIAEPPAPCQVSLIGQMVSLLEVCGVMLRSAARAADSTPPVLAAK